MIRLIKNGILLLVGYYGFHTIFMQLFVIIYRATVQFGIPPNVFLNMYNTSMFMGLIATIIMFKSYRNARVSNYRPPKNKKISKIKVVLAIILTLGAVVFIYNKYYDYNMMRKIREKYDNDDSRSNAS